MSMSKSFIPGFTDRTQVGGTLFLNFIKQFISASSDLIKLSIGEISDFKSFKHSATPTALIAHEGFLSPSIFAHFKWDNRITKQGTYPWCHFSYPMPTGAQGSVSSVFLNIVEDQKVSTTSNMPRPDISLPHLEMLNITLTESDKSVLNDIKPTSFNQRQGTIKTKLLESGR